MDELLADILEELQIELSVTKESDLAILQVKLKNAFREVESAINFQAHHTSEFKLKEIKRYIGQIKDLTMYDYSMVGAESQTSYSENGIDRKWKDRKNCFSGIVRFADI